LFNIGCLVFNSPFHHNLISVFDAEHIYRRSPVADVHLPEEAVCFCFQIQSINQTSGKIVYFNHNRSGTAIFQINIQFVAERVGIQIHRSQDFSVWFGCLFTLIRHIDIFNRSLSKWVDNLKCSNIAYNGITIQTIAGNPYPITSCVRRVCQ